MASLSGNTIQDTYDGLLKLNDSTSGITSSFQPITDGLGNDTGTQIKENGLWSRTQLYQDEYKYEYYGVGITSSQISFGASVYGQPTWKAFQYFYNNGLYSYSAVSVNVSTTTSDDNVVEFAFYDTQYVNGIGLVPKTRLTNVFSVDFTTAGLQTFTFGSPLTLNPGYCFLVWRAYNNVSPGNNLTGRVRSMSTATWMLANQGILGFTESDEGLGYYYNPFGSRSTTGASYPIYDITGFPGSLSSGDITSGRLNASPQGSGIGFILHTI